MKPVFQTRKGSDGNCLAACLASILELPLEKVDFTANGEWLAKTQEILKPFGFFYLGVAIDKHITLMAMPENYCVFVGDTIRTKDTGLLHCVVGRLVMEDKNTMLRFVTAHDPLGENSGWLSELKPKELGFLIPINPHLTGALQ
ncbi:MAG: hypothetical protein JWM68_3755 [Verrucomicrobiales bacterium]|nr:hypothetical protein [Verrucomicrobiales bacterium]